MSRQAIRIQSANPADEGALRELLRRQPLPGWITLGFEREPDYFAAAAMLGERHDVLLARHPGTEGMQAPPIAICARAVQRVFVNGETRRLGYLGQFRTAESTKTGWQVYRLLRRGFEAVHRLHRDDELPYDITSILSDNHAARRLLCADLKGLPTYDAVGQLHTLVYRCRGGRKDRPSPVIENGSQVGLAAIADCLQRNYRRYQFAPVWDEGALTRSGLRAENFLVIRSNDRVVACVAIWDQRAARQMVVHAYRRPVAATRSLINLFAPWFGMPRLPPRGETLRQAWLSHLASDQDDPAHLQALLPAALEHAHRLGLEQLFLGLTGQHPLLPVARGVRRHLVYRSDIYLVRWPQSGGGGNSESLLSRPVLLEAATL